MSETPKTDAAYKACRSAGALGIIDHLTQCSALLERQLEEANERNGNMAVELAAMTQERDALRREVEALRKEAMALAWLASVHCYRDECCPKQPLSQPLDRGTCINCTIERARETIKVAQAGKGGAE